MREPSHRLTQHKRRGSRVLPPLGVGGRHPPSLEGIKARGGNGGLEPHLRSTLCSMSRELFEHYLSDGAGWGRRPTAPSPGRPAEPPAATSRGSRWSSRAAWSPTPPSTPRAAGRRGPRPRRPSIWSAARASCAAARIGTDEVDAAIGGLTPAKRHAAQLAADALHRALASAAASSERLAPPGERRVLVAMSGGVDSAVAALLERERGAEVVGVTVKLWADPETDGAKACCSPEAVLGARGLAHSLGIPHLTLDLEEEFRRRVVAGFVAGYAAGRTPNPCILCNGEVRIAAMVDLAERLGATHLVTGHYARIVDDGAGPLLAAAADAAKDQSYMLAALPPELLGRLRFPLTELTKPEVREIAARHGLAVARKPESQDLCFLAGQGKRAIPAPPRRPARARRRRAATAPGSAIGRHRGHHNFTVGQRRGIRRLGPRAALRPRHRRRGEHGHGRHPRGAGDAKGAHPRRRPAPRRRLRRRGPAPLPLPPPAGGDRRGGDGPPPRSRSSSARPSPAPPRARPRCCSPARRSSATARSPPRPDASALPKPHPGRLEP